MTLAAAVEARSADDKLRALHHGLESLYQTRSGLDPVALVHRLPDGPRETLLVREVDDAVELALVFGDATLKRLEQLSIDDAFSDTGIGETLPVLEGLSHLAYITEAARREKPVSGLELETQAEVDKLALILLQRWPDTSVFERLVDRLYTKFELLPGPRDLQQRYIDATRIARSFARTLERVVNDRKLSEFRTQLRAFWNAGMNGKRQLAQAP